MIELIRGDLQRAGTHAERAAAAYAAGREPLLEAKALTQLASIANASDDPERALALCERAGPVLRAGGELDTLGVALMATAESGRRLGDLERARHAAEEAVELRASRGNTRGAGFARVVLADIEQRRGDQAAAARLLLRPPVRQRARRSGEPRPEPLRLRGVARRFGDHDAAARLLGAAEATLRKMGRRRFEMEREDYFEPVLEEFGRPCTRRGRGPLRRRTRARPRGGDPSRTRASSRHRRLTRMEAWLGRRRRRQLDDAS